MLIASVSLVCLPRIIPRRDKRCKWLQRLAFNQHPGVRRCVSARGIGNVTTRRCVKSYRTVSPSFVIERSSVQIRPVALRLTSFWAPRSVSLGVSLLREVERFDSDGLEGQDTGR